MELSGPLHLHKCLSGAYTDILAVVPPCTGECRIVCGYPVGITPQHPDLWGFCGGADGMLAACSPASGYDQRQDFVRTTIVTECADLASIAGGETAPNADSESLIGCKVVE